MLRRFLCVLSVTVLLSGLCACGNIKVPFELGQFTAHVSFQSAGTKIKGELTYNSPEDISFKITEPENIKGLEFKSVSHSMNVTVGEVSFTPDTEKESPIYLLFELLGDIAQSDISIPLKGEEKTTLQYEGEPYHIKTDCEEKKLISVETESYRYIFE